MKNVFALFFLLQILMGAPLFAQHTVPDAQVLISQNMLNKFFKAMGAVSGTNSSGSGFSKVDYKWVVKNPSIVIKKDKASFTADVQIQSNLMNYNTPANGEVDISYDPDKNLIFMKLKNAYFDIYFELFGKRIKITEVDITRFYKAEFKFSGPKMAQTDFDLDLPSGKKKLYINAVNRKMALEPEAIVVTTDFVFSEQPFSK